MTQQEIDSLKYGDAIIVWGDVPQYYSFVAAHPCGSGYICTKNISGAPIYCDLTEAAYFLRVRERWVIINPKCYMMHPTKTSALEQWKARGGNGDLEIVKICDE